MICHDCQYWRKECGECNGHESWYGGHRIVYGIISCDLFKKKQK